MLSSSSLRPGTAPYEIILESGFLRRCYMHVTTTVPRYVVTGMLQRFLPSLLQACYNGSLLRCYWHVKTVPCYVVTGMSGFFRRCYMHVTTISRVVVTCIMSTLFHASLLQRFLTSQETSKMDQKSHFGEDSDLYQIDFYNMDRR